MVMAHWPAHGKRGERGTIPDSVRRRVDEATRRGVRSAVRVGAPLIAVGVGADAVHLVVRFGDAGALPAALELAGIAAALALALVAVRFVRRPEPPVIAILVLLFAVTLINARLLPEVAPASAAYLATLLVGSALFLTWATAWHLAWLSAAGGMAALNLALALGTPLAGTAASLLMASVVAGLASLVGQPLAYARLRRMLEAHFELRRVSRLAVSQEHEVAVLNRELLRTARTDTVTGIGNRRALDEALVKLAGRRLAAVLLDVDHFKAFNDANGHLAGDAALARIGEILRGTVRQDDQVFRYGGEEFLILLPGADRDSAAALAERVRAAVEEDATAAASGLTISAGVAVADRFSAGSPLPLLRRADAALYQAKRAGRNQVVVDGPTAPLRVIVS